VPGTHDTIIDDNHVANFAPLFRKVLYEVQAKAQPELTRMIDAEMESTQPAPGSHP
jgi:hypothetical protein